MRYLIAGTNPEITALGDDLLQRGLLISRAQSPDDMMAFLDLMESDLMVIEAGWLCRDGLSLQSLRRRQPDLPTALFQALPDGAEPGAWLSLGADTVVNAALSADEIAARLMAVARRAHGVATPHLRLGPLHLDLERRTAALRGEPLGLTPKVYEVLEFLALRAGKLVTRETLLIHMYGLEDEPESRVFDVYMHTLRSRLRAASGAIDLVTERGSGVRLRVSESRQNKA